MTAPPGPETDPISLTIVAISDTHRMHDRLELPEGDVLIHCGDFGAHGTRAEFCDFVDWFAAQPHARKVFIAGNHDRYVERHVEECRAYVPDGVDFLIDESVIINGKHFYGSPYTPEFCDWAFMENRGRALKDRWQKIPYSVDVLMTHGPPYGHGDLCPGGWMSPQSRVVGCLELLKRVKEVKPRLHFFGHIHEGHGVTESDEAMGTTFLNVAICDGAYDPINPPTVVHLR